MHRPRRLASRDTAPVDCPPPAPAPAPPVQSARVAPARAFFGGRPVTVAFRLRGCSPESLAVEIARVRGGRVVRRLALRAAAPHALLRLRWNGLTGAGRAAPDGRYVVRVRAGGGGPARRLGSFVLRGYVYPVRGRHRDRGGIGVFGAPRSGGRIHQGYDVDAACGTPLVAARAGRVVRRVYDPVLYGNLVVIRAAATRRDLWYAHMSRVSVRRGRRVRTGQRIGSVGATGNARFVGCELHFEVRDRGRPIDPQPLLRAWDSWS